MTDGLVEQVNKKICESRLFMVFELSFISPNILQSVIYNTVIEKLH